MRVSDDKVGVGDAEEPKRPQIARVLLVGGSGALSVQAIADVTVPTNYEAEGQRLAEFLFWYTPWKFFAGLQKRLNELKPPDTDRYSRLQTH